MPYQVRITKSVISYSEEDEPVLTFTMTFEADVPNLNENPTVDVSVPAAEGLASVYSSALCGGLARDLASNLRSSRGTGSYSSS